MELYPTVLAGNESSEKQSSLAQLEIDKTTKTGYIWRQSKLILPETTTCCSTSTDFGRRLLSTNNRLLIGAGLAKRRLLYFYSTTTSLDNINGLTKIKPAKSIFYYGILHPMGANNSQHLLYGGGESGKQFYQTTADLNQFNQLETIPENVFFPAVSTNPETGLVHLAGGAPSRYGFSKCHSNVCSFDPFSGRWQSSPAMQHARGFSGSAWLNGLLYVTGGFNKDLIKESHVESWDPRMKCWSQSTPLPVGRSHHAAFVFNEKLFVCGGVAMTAGCRPTGDHSRTADLFDPVARRWMDAPQLDGPNILAGVAFLTFIT